jgi:hypothetical protein
MDTLNEQYPIYPPNPDNLDLDSFYTTTTSDSSSGSESENDNVKKKSFNNLDNLDNNNNTGNLDNISTLRELGLHEIGHGGNTGITITKALKRQNKKIKKRNEFYNQQRAHVQNIIYINRSRKKKINILFDEWTTFYSDDLWTLWCIMSEFISESGLPFFNKINYVDFVKLCFRHSTKHQ